MRVLELYNGECRRNTMRASEAYDEVCQSVYKCRKNMMSVERIR